MTAFVLKIIALTCMIIDHVGAFLGMYFVAYYDVTLRIIGRVSFPIYVYLIAEGCRHTRSMPKYLARLGAFALISQIPFDLVFNQSNSSLLHISFIKDTNVFYTLFLGAVSIYFFQKLRDTKIPFLWLASMIPLVVVVWLANWMITDYAGFGVVFVFLMYVIPKKRWRLCVMALCCIYEFKEVAYSALYHAFGFVRYEAYAWAISSTWAVMLLSCLVSVPLVAFYNGKRGPGLKWFFYIAYPAHLMVLAGVWFWLVR